MSVDDCCRVSFILDVSRGLNLCTQGRLRMKPANILVDQVQNGRLFCALTDFGISQAYTENAQLVGAFKVVNLRKASIAYAAPEVVTRFGNRGDVTMELAFAGDVYVLG